MKLLQQLIFIGLLMMFLPISLAFDICSDLAGNWKGQGMLYPLGIRCYYYATAEWLPTSNPREYHVNFSLEKDMTRPFCPAIAAFTLTGLCQQGFVHFDQDETHLTANIAVDKTAFQLRGYLAIDIGDQHLPVLVKSLDFTKVTHPNQP